jgi:multicomponent Na+:H+ antiporter subunit C
MSGLVGAIVVGGLGALGLYLVLHRSVIRVVFGLAILSHAVNLLVFLAAGTTPGGAPFVPEGGTAPPPGHADPVPQALVLTAIVIGFALVAFTAVLVQRAVVELGTADVDRIRETDR